MQRGARMSHVSKKRRLNKPLSIYTPPLLQQRSHQAHAVHQCNRLSTLFQSAHIPRPALNAPATGWPPCLPSRFSFSASLQQQFGKFIPVKLGLGRDTRASAAELRASLLCQELFVAQLPNSQTEKLQSGRGTLSRI